jgi:hypothetical protein
VPFEYRDDSARALPKEYYGQARDADSIWGDDDWRQMTYMGSTQSKYEQDGWRSITDYFVDGKGRWRTHNRYMKKGPDGNPVYVSSSVRIFGKHKKEWESAGKNKK